MQKFIQSFLTTTFLFLLTSLSVFAQANGSISGRVIYTENQTPLHDAQVQIVQLKLSAATDDDGNYKFENVPAGRYTIQAQTDGFSASSKTVVLTAGANSTIDFSLQIGGVKEQVTVTASGEEVSTFDSFQSVSTLGANEIAQRNSTSIGEVLEREPGVAKRSFGPGTARPVIRGFDGDRVLVLQNGVRVGSIGSGSGDHGEPIDPLSVERLEVVKGPATLLYGSSAIGGVVNAIGQEDDDKHPGLRGAFTALAGTNNKQAGIGGNIEYGYKNWLFFGNGSGQRASDYFTPLGRVPNSASRSTSGLGGFGYFTVKGFVRASYTYYTSRYGVPFAGFIESGGVSNDEEIDLKLRRHNARVNAGFRDVNSFVTSGNFKIDYTDYRHNELADNVIGTQFDNDTFSYRGVFEQKKYGKLSGRFGFEGFNRNFLNTGAELLVDGRVKQNMFSVFGLEELNLGRVSFQFGARVENNRFRADNTNFLDRDFTGVSGAAGVRVRLWEGGALVSNYSNSYRAPALEELYNNGPHVGTISFEVGNQNLKRERSNGIDFGLRHSSNRFRFDASAYYYRLKDFVYFAFADLDGDGEVDREDGLPLSFYSQGDSRYIGAEVNFDTDINKYVNFFFTADVVRAKLTSGNLNLPRIPPSRARIGVDLKYKNLSVRPEAVFADEQNRLYPLETRTAGYGLFNVGASYIIGRDHYAHIFGMNAYNLLDKEYRNHLSFIKELAPEIGRGIRFNYTIRFF
ncbi:MAG: TonB-dependent receptor [Pyrinomonadaceae bacterium]|nr:TonB-dependent receptor [Pyrinomonadaceae bacterium]